MSATQTDSSWLRRAAPAEDVAEWVLSATLAGLLLLMTAADLLNGMLVRLVGITWFSTVYKSAFFPLLLLILLVRRRSVDVYILLAVTAVATIGLLLKGVVLPSADALAEVWLYVKGPLLFAAVAASVMAFDRGWVTETARRFALACWATIGLSVLFSALTGVGFRTYERDGIGFKSFFVAGNEITFLFVFCWWLYFFHFVQDRRGRLLGTLATVVVTFLIATKAGFVLMALLLTWWVLTYALGGPVKASVAAVIGGVVAIILVEPIVFALGPLHPAWPRIEFFVERYGVVQAITGSRSVFALAAIETLQGFSVFEWVFGAGFEPFWREALGKSIESDPFDLLGGGGLLLLLWFYGIAFAMFAAAAADRRQWALAGLVFAVVVYSVFVGHVVYANTPMIAFGLVAGLLARTLSAAEGAAGGGEVGPVAGRATG